MTTTPTYPLPSSSSLEVGRLSRIFDNMNECYKLFWFQAILTKISEGQERFTFEELLDQMIVDAWYMVSEYKLNLGPADTLEALVHYVYENSGIKSSEKKEKLQKFLEDCRAGRIHITDSEGKNLNRELIRRKKVLILNVPYRLQAPFLDSMEKKAWDLRPALRAERINMEKRLMYYFSHISGLDTVVEITPPWYEYLTANQEILRGWIQFNMIAYLQRRNPNVPGIINKLQPPQERNLNKVKKFWTAVSQVTEIKDIYAGETMGEKGMSIDHFVPWSYVAHDEFWNLSPTTRSANSSKSNSLPEWEYYFPRFCDVHIQAYDAIWEYGGVREIFEKCRKEHINSDEAWMKLYSPELSRESFTHNLGEILQPVWLSAHNLGFKEWRYNESDTELL